MIGKSLLIRIFYGLPVSLVLKRLKQENNSAFSTG